VRTFSSIKTYLRLYIYLMICLSILYANLNIIYHFFKLYFISFFIKQSINFRFSFEFFLYSRIALFYWLSSIFTVGRYFSFLCTFPYGLAVKSGKEVVNSFITTRQQFVPVAFLFPSVSLLPLRNRM